MINQIYREASVKKDITIILDKNDFVQYFQEKKVVDEMVRLGIISITEQKSIDNDSTVYVNISVNNNLFIQYIKDEHDKSVMQKMGITEQKERLLEQISKEYKKYKNLELILSEKILGTYLAFTNFPYDSAERQEDNMDFNRVVHELAKESYFEVLSFDFDIFAEPSPHSSGYEKNIDVTKPREIDYYFPEHCQYKIKLKSKFLHTLGIRKTKVCSYSKSTGILKIGDKEKKFPSKKYQNLMLKLIEYSQKPIAKQDILDIMGANNDNNKNDSYIINSIVKYLRKRTGFSKRVLVQKNSTISLKTTILLDP